MAWSWDDCGMVFFMDVGWIFDGFWKHSGIDLGWILQDRGRFGMHFGIILCTNNKNIKKTENTEKSQPYTHNKKTTTTNTYKHTQKVQINDKG